MTVFRLDEKYLRPVVFLTTGLFLFFSVLYFCGIGPSYRIALPLMTLTVCSLWLTPLEITLAMFFSALGDFFGAEGLLIAQMGGFAAAHICLAVFFVCRYRSKSGKDGRLTAKMKGYLMLVVILTLALLGFVFTNIVPAAPAGLIRTGTGIYACLICFMLVCALIQRSTLYASGAILFVFSDFILAWNMFTEPIPHAGLLIMIPYYIGQWLLFVRSTPYRIPGLRRHRM